MKQAHRYVYQPRIDCEQFELQVGQLMMEAHVTNIRLTAQQLPGQLDQQSGWLNGVKDEAPQLDASAVIQFGRFVVVPRARQLLADGRPMEIGSRAFDLLMVLIKASGTLVTKTEIMARVWPSTRVDESNLRVQMVKLRSALGEDRDIIKTVSGSGYIFTVSPSSTARYASPRATIDAKLPPKAALGPPVFPRRSAENSRFNLVSMEAQPAIVVIDDDDDIREALAAVLDSVGWHAELFASVSEFLEKGSPERTRCLVLDVRLPGKSGLDFHDDLIKADVHLPVVFISGHADVPMTVRAMKAGAVEFLTKPIRHQDFLDAIQLAVKSSALA